MKLGLKYAQEMLTSNGTQRILPAIQADPYHYEYVHCQMCKGKGIDKIKGGKCGVCLGFKVIYKAWWFDWDHPLDLLKKPPNEECYNVSPLVNSVSKGLHGWYFQKPECYYCPLDRQDPIPECYKDCRFKVRPRGQKNGPIQVIDTKRDFPPEVETPHGTLLIARAVLDFNFREELPFIVRNGRGNGTELDHIFGVPWDDRPGHYRLTTEHRKIEGYKATCKRHLERINDLNKIHDFDSKELKKLLYETQRSRESLDTRGPDSTVWRYIFDMYRVAAQFKEFKEVPVLLRRRIESYYKLPRRIN